MIVDINYSGTKNKKILEQTYVLGKTKKFQMEVNFLNKKKVPTSFYMHYM